MKASVSRPMPPPQTDEVAVSWGSAAQIAAGLADDPVSPEDLL